MKITKTRVDTSAHHTWDAKVKLERLALTGVLGEEQLPLNRSSLWRLVLNDKSEICLITILKTHLLRIGSDKDL